MKEWNEINEKNKQMKWSKMKKMKWNEWKKYEAKKIILVLVENKNATYYNLIFLLTIYNSRILSCKNKAIRIKNTSSWMNCN